MKKALLGFGGLIILGSAVLLFINANVVNGDDNKSRTEVKTCQTTEPCTMQCKSAGETAAKCDPATCKEVNCNPEKCTKTGCNPATCVKKSGGDMVSAKPCNPATCPGHAGKQASE